ncbi:ATP-dependent DNA helicase RecG [Clostridium sp. JN-1]|uniref:ATP-dependent DNA helicase RecG n=1 Tax=Clostridium sp. JN-1 TaxID=2483110 RepID=UPI000F0AF6CF|nr:ATP-dependent DNA helicase RecG [Clostridium sp. JN-1]
MDIYDNITVLKGVGPKTAESLNKLFIFTIMDLLLYFPRDYEIISLCSDIKGDKTNQKVIVNCNVQRIERDIRTKTGKVITTILFSNGKSFFKGKWFNQPYMKNNFKINNTYTISGKLEQFKGELFIINPKIIKGKLANNTRQKIIPKYALTSGITNNTIIKLIFYLLRNIKIEENLPKSLIYKYKLCDLDKAIRTIHNPVDFKELNEAKRRLKFQELFTYSLKILMLKDKVLNNRGRAFKIASDLVKLKDSLPYPLTKAQNKVIREILIDEKREKTMGRLVQGDVGSGKTIVALISIFNVIKNGYQAVLMAPTEILAKQHFLEASNLFKDFDVNTKLLTGSTAKKEKERIKDELKNGEIDFVIGTHALIEDDVEFKKLGIVVTDEQHRFGVMQRNKLTNKSKDVDTLVMTATPIPRTLTLCLYGDLDVSIIDELPPGRQKIETYYVNKVNKDKAYNFVLSEVEKGRQAYVVCPLVQENETLGITSAEELFKELKEKYFKNICIKVLHGKMSPKEKEQVMEEFKEGLIKVLISTTVIEVGINVPNATVMVVENAERFGLSQLHQLRGRVGRGKYKSYCILITDVKNDIIRRRMEIMESSNDGFFIAEQDLKIRGGGEVFGFKQHGEDTFLLSDVVEDMGIFKFANLEAKKLIISKDENDIKIKNQILNKLKQTSKLICFN